MQSILSVTQLQYTLWLCVKWTPFQHILKNFEEFNCIAHIFDTLG